MKTTTKTKMEKHIAKRLKAIERAAPTSERIRRLRRLIKEIDDLQAEYAKAKGGAQ